MTSGRKPCFLGTSSRRRGHIRGPSRFVKLFLHPGRHPPPRAQQGQRLRRVGTLMNLAVEDPVSIARAKAFAQGLQALGWIDGRNVQVDYRWAASNADLFQRYAAELVALAPDVILAAGAAL